MDARSSDRSKKVSGLAEHQSWRQKGVQGDLPLERKILQYLLVNNGTIVSGTNLLLEVKKPAKPSHTLMQIPLHKLKKSPFRPARLERGNL